MRDLLMQDPSIRPMTTRLLRALALVVLLMCTGIGPDIFVVTTTSAWAAAAKAEQLLPAGALRVDNGFVRGLPPGRPVTSAYFTLSNTSGTALVLVGARSPNAERVEIHSHEMQNGMARMRKRDSVSIPAHGSVQFATGGLHLMLFRLKGSFANDARIPITLLFAGRSRVEVVLPVCSVLQETCP